MKVISIVSPCYDEEGNVEVLTDRVREIFAGLPQYRQLLRTQTHLFQTSIRRGKNFDRSLIDTISSATCYSAHQSA